MYLRLAAVLAFVPAAFPQMTVDQKVTDFQTLASLYAKQYAPYEWKRDTLKYDLLDLRPWLARVRTSRDDLEYHEIASEYVAALTDVHSEYFVPSTFRAKLGFDVDVYDGKLLIDAIDREALPESKYPFSVGDEIVSVDGRSPADWIAFFSRFQSFGNKRSSDRWSAGYIASRSQAEIARAADLGDTASVTIRGASGNVATFSIPWNKEGEAYVGTGRVPSPRLSDEASLSVGGTGYMRPLFGMQQLRPVRRMSAKGFGAIAPVFKLPETFAGRRNSYFHVGVYVAEGKRIGYIRIPEFQPLPFESLVFAYAAFDREIRFLQTNTDGLVVDVMRNPGGYGCYAEELLRRLMPSKFFGAMHVLRPTTRVLAMYQEVVAEAKDTPGVETWELANLEDFTRQIVEADRGRTLAGPFPLCAAGFHREPVTQAADGLSPYTKPVILLVDEFTTSAGDLFAAMFQDSKRGPVVGWRTAGAGGAVEIRDAGYFSEGYTGITTSLLVRPDAITTPDFAATTYIENVGVRPDVTLDYMTRENLIRDGRPFVDAFTAVILKEIARVPLE